MSILVERGGHQFYVTEDYSMEDLLQVQARSLEMFVEIAAVLDRHGIRYTLGYGSLLGMVRHGGFIPWDDDIDLFIVDQDYARAILHLRRELPEHMLLHDKRNDPVYWVTWVKVRDLNSWALESAWKIDRRLKFHGVCIDLIRVGQTTVGKRRHALEVRRLKARLRRVKAEIRREVGPVKRALAMPSYLLQRSALTVKGLWLRLQLKVGSKRLLVAAPGTVIETSFAYDDFFPIQRDGGTFEGRAVPAPRNPEAVLTAMYGDFDRLPPLESRIPHFERVEFYEPGGAE